MRLLAIGLLLLCAGLGSATATENLATLTAQELIDTVRRGNRTPEICVRALYLLVKFPESEEAKEARGILLEAARDQQHWVLFDRQQMDRILNDFAIEVEHRDAIRNLAVFTDPAPADPPSSKKPSAPPASTPAGD